MLLNVQKILHQQAIELGKQEYLDHCQILEVHILVSVYIHDANDSAGAESLAKQYGTWYLVIMMNFGILQLK